MGKILAQDDHLELTAINDLTTDTNLAYLLKYDTVYGRFEKEVEARGEQLLIGGRPVRLLHEQDPLHLPWRELGIDLVFECTGVLNERADLEKHRKAGARYVLLSAPAKDADVETVVHGVNRPAGRSDGIVSCASCTTNAIAPICEILDRRLGVHKAAMTTVHAYTATQSVVDGPNKKLRRGRAAAVNLIPTTTGATGATARALPSYQDRFSGAALRVPVVAASLADLVFVTKRGTGVQEVNTLLAEEAESDRYRGIVGVTGDPIVSADVIKDPRASLVDMEMTTVVDEDLVKIMAWYDNEWGYANQMVREALRLVTP